jgi:IS30 family transposase
MAKRAYRHVTDAKRRLAFRMAAGGASHREIAAAVDQSRSMVQVMLRPFGGVYRDAGSAAEPAEPARGLCLDQRIEIAIGLRAGEPIASIAARVGRSRSAIHREVARNGGRGRYRPGPAHRGAADRARRPKPAKLALRPDLARRVAEDLRRFWSPQTISRRLRLEFGDDGPMTISHETIYKSLYVQGRGLLRDELAECLRTGRAARRPRGRLEARGRIPGMIPISERPAEADDRAVPGHWEGDLIMGAGNRSAIGTLVERTTRFVMLLHLPGDHRAETVRDAMAARILTLPEALRRSIAWDQGSEMSQHAKFTIDTGVPIYFCDPHSPWQRGTNENTNGLLRQYFPKGTDLAAHDAARLDAVADSLNDRPRMTLDYLKPAERMEQLLR